MLDLLREFAGRLDESERGRRFAGAFDTAVQLRWTEEPLDAGDMSVFGGAEGSWACLVVDGGRISVHEGDQRDRHDWRFCPLVETDEETLRAVLTGSLRPLDAYLADRLHVSHFTVAGTSGQWVLALLAFGQRTNGSTGILPARAEKRFMTHSYVRAAERRRDELRHKIGLA
jgi:hypothetical protein